MGSGKEIWGELEMLLNKQDWGGAASLFSSDAVYSTPNFRHDGPEEIHAFLEAGGLTFPDMIGETTLLIEEGDTVVAEWTYQGTNTGPFVVADGTEISATGKTMELNGVTVCQIRGGKFTSMRDYFDSASMMTQLGLMPNT